MGVVCGMLCQGQARSSRSEGVKHCREHQPLTAIVCMSLYTPEVRSNEWILSGKPCNLQGFHSYDGGNPKTGQAGGLP